MIDRLQNWKLSQKFVNATETSDSVFAYTDIPMLKETFAPLRFTRKIIAHIATKKVIDEGFGEAVTSPTSIC